MHSFTGTGKHDFEITLGLKISYFLLLGEDFFLKKEDICWCVEIVRGLL